MVGVSTGRITIVDYALKAPISPEGKVIRSLHRRSVIAWGREAPNGDYRTLRMCSYQKWISGIIEVNRSIGGKQSAPIFFENNDDIPLLTLTPNLFASGTKVLS